jgi:CheY-like chemotaxis protein
MQDAPGVALLEQLHKMPGCSELRSVFLLPATMPQYSAKCRLLGADSCLNRPVCQSELYDVIHQLFGLREAQALPSEKPATSSKNLKILIAEDNKSLQVLAARLLEKRGCNVTVVSNGREAVQAAAEQEFDAVLMDVGMPEMDGFAATAEIRKQEKSTGRHLPIIALTAHAMHDERNLCVSAGMDGYIAKPFTPQTLYDTINTICG